MKIIKYQLMTKVNHGTEEEPNIVQTFQPCEIRCSESNLEANLELVKREAYNGEYTVEDDGQPDPSEEQLTQEERIAELEEAMDMLLSGVTE